MFLFCQVRLQKFFSCRNIVEQVLDDNLCAFVERNLFDGGFFLRVGYKMSAVLVFGLVMSGLNLQQ